MKYLLWSIAVVLLLALVNAVASWFGLDVASGGEEPTRDHHTHAAPGHAPAAAAAAHAPAGGSAPSHH
jgi:hypothetical protein